MLIDLNVFGRKSDNSQIRPAKVTELLPHSAKMERERRVQFSSTKDVAYIFPMSPTKLLMLRNFTEEQISQRNKMNADLHALKSILKTGGNKTDAFRTALETADCFLSEDSYTQLPRTPVLRRKVFARKNRTQCDNDASYNQSMENEVINNQSARNDVTTNQSASQNLPSNKHRQQQNKTKSLQKNSDTFPCLPKLTPSPKFSPFPKASRQPVISCCPSQTPTKRLKIPDISNYSRAGGRILERSTKNKITNDCAKIQDLSTNCIPSCRQISRRYGIANHAELENVELLREESFGDKDTQVSLIDSNFTTDNDSEKYVNNNNPCNNNNNTVEKCNGKFSGIAVKSLPPVVTSPIKLKSKLRMRKTKKEHRVPLLENIDC